jgi:tyrosinase
VDRIFALWQTMNPTVWVSPGLSQEGTWTIPANSQEDKNSRLTPFWNGPGSNDYWNSQTCRSWEVLGYTYPDFEGLTTTDPAARKAAITARLQHKSSPNTPTPGRFQFPALLALPEAEKTADCMLALMYPP